MKGIYLTQEGKQEIEAKIAQLNKWKIEPDAFFTLSEYQRMIDVYKEILSSATILPVEESWGDMPIGSNESEMLYPQGVIIQPKEQKP
jgi:hypothetical protein